MGLDLVSALSSFRPCIILFPSDDSPTTKWICLVLLSLCRQINVLFFTWMKFSSVLEVIFDSGFVVIDFERTSYFMSAFADSKTLFAESRADLISSLSSSKGPSSYLRIVAYSVNSLSPGIFEKWVSLMRRSSKISIL